VVAVLTQRLLEEKLQLPKIQALIYPWTQMFNNHLPSMIEYGKSGLLSTTVSLQKMAAMYLGVIDETDEVEKALVSNNHTALLTDKNLKARIKSYLDVAQIPDKYKKGRKYYASYDTRKQFMYPEQLDADNILVTDKDLAGVLKKLYDPKVSPLFADDAKLVGLPRAYFAILEWDSLKDEGLLYAERLRKNNVPVHVEFYEDAFHAIINFPHAGAGFQKARDIRDNMITYLQSNL
jgi:acetyl esterase/lipase